MALTRTWTTSLNNVPSDQSTIVAQNKEVILELKKTYVSAGWAVKGSADGLGGGASVGDDVDRWANSVANVNWESGGSNHSWIVLESPSGHPSSTATIYVTIACSTGVGNEEDINFHFATAIPTGGSATADPSQPSNVRTMSNKQVVETPISNSKYHFMHNTDGDVVFLVSEDGTGYAAFANCSLESINFDTNCKYPWIGMCAYNDVALGGFTIAASVLALHSAMVWQDDSFFVNGFFGVCTVEMNTVKWNLNFDSAGSDISGEQCDLPAIIASRQAFEIGNFGALVDISIGPIGTGVVGGLERPGSGATEQALFGEFWTPNGAVSPSL